MHNEDLYSHTECHLHSVSIMWLTSIMADPASMLRHAPFLKLRSVIYWDC